MVDLYVLRDPYALGVTSAESALGSGSLNGVSGALPRCGDRE
jgi:hypothetical protein